MARNSKRNWDRLKDQSYSETARGRDVFNEQQLGRGKLQEKQSITSRKVAGVLLAILAFVIVYAMWAGIAGIAGTFSGMTNAVGRYDAKGGQVSGYCVYETNLIALETNEARDEAGNIYELDENGWYVKIEETMESRYGEDVLVEMEAAELPDVMGEESSGEEIVSEAVEDVSEANIYTWGNSSIYDVGLPFTATVNRGTQILTPIKVDGLYRDDDGRLYEIAVDHAVQIHENINQYFEENPDLVPVEKSAIWPKSIWQVLISLLAGLIVYAIFMQFMKKNLVAQNMLADTEDINQYTNDQHIALPEEIQRKYDWFPDVGAHSSVQVSSMISHMALTNKGVRKIQVAKRYKENVVDESGTVVYYKGEIMRDADGNTIYETVPMFDEKFSDALFEASGAPKEVRMSYDPSVIPYNPGNQNRDKLTGPYDGPPLKRKSRVKKGETPVAPGKFETVTDLINKDWTFPDYEPQRPAGAYIVDTQPVNTMVLAITRAGKGQTVIEPTIDMWTREHRGNNMVINDPKGELLVKFYTRGAYRGYQIVQFNLINPMKTDIYNRASCFTVKSCNLANIA